MKPIEPPRLVVDGTVFHSSLDEHPNPTSPLLTLAGPLEWTPAAREDIAYSIHWHATPWWRRWSKQAR